jgi:uncharacterized protein (DUF2384 family)
MADIGHNTHSDTALIVSKAVTRAADLLGVSSARLADILGLSPATISRMKREEFALDPNSKSYELSLMFIRLFRSLDAIVGGDEKVARQWLRSFNTALNAKPIDILPQVTGLMDALNYLDSRRAKV